MLDLIEKYIDPSISVEEKLFEKATTDDLPLSLHKK